MSVMPERTVMKRAVILQRKESKAYNIGLWPKPKTRHGDNGTNKAKALMRRLYAIPGTTATPKLQ